ncbi:MAG TPA: hypothetical protein VFB67_05285 [Candidatus Polarisedimenticolaceae bacterium]|nr:hypothetical protein [Candidatus Polarisedimenticolaceae bacterium]
MSSRTRSTVAHAVVGVAIAVAAAMLVPAKAEIDIDVRGGVNTDAEGPFVGAGILTNIGGSHSWYFNPNAEYTAGDTTDVLSLNADVHYDFATASKWSPWLGAGPAFVTYDPEFGEDDDNDVGLNLLAGVGAKHGKVRPFVQGKALVADNSEFLIAGGIRW